MRGRRLKGEGKGVLGARETRGAREEGGKTNTNIPMFLFFELYHFRFLEYFFGLEIFGMGFF